MHTVATVLLLAVASVSNTKQSLPFLFVRAVRPSHAARIVLDRREYTVVLTGFGVGMNVGCDDCNDDARARGASVWSVSSRHQRATVASAFPC